MITISLIKADVGGFVGHSNSHPEILALARKLLSRSKLLVDYQVTNCGDDLELIMTHNKGEDNKDVHKLAWNVFVQCTALAKKLGLYGAGQDLLKSTFSGNVKGMGPGIAEMSIEERPSEPVLVFMGDKCAPGAWNYPLYKIFADPFNTAGLVIDPELHDGFTFEVMDVKEDRTILLKCPEQVYDLLVLIGNPSRYIIRSIYRNSDGLLSARSTTTRLSLIAGKYVGKDDPGLIVRAQKGLPAVGEILEPFAFPHLTEGWMRGSHNGPLMPVSLSDNHPARFDGPPRVICLGFQLTKGKLIGPIDMFDDVSFDEARKQANKAADYLRRHGPFKPHRLDDEEMEYTTLPQLLAEMKDKFTEAGVRRNSYKLMKKELENKIIEKK